VLTFRIQPDEQVTLQLNNKVPGFGIELRPGAYRFGYKEGFMSHIPSAYERLLLDFLEGDQRLFTGSGEVEAAWAYVDSVRRSWGSVPLLPYTVGTPGPKESEQFAESFGGWSTR
jgi:glucose-6-phosphate 1-dehydrogenase